MNKNKIEIEGIWKDGFSFRMKISFPSSTGVATVNLKGEANRDDNPWLTRFYYDGALCREFDYVLNKYTLCIDIPGEMRVPLKDPVL